MTPAMTSDGGVSKGNFRGRVLRQCANLWPPTKPTNLPFLVKHWDHTVMHWTYIFCILSLLMPSIQMADYATILSHKWQKWRLHEKYNPRKNFLRKNLFRDADPLAEKTAICSHYIIMHMRSGCEAQSSLYAGQWLCVECDAFTQSHSTHSECNGMGQFAHISSWGILNTKCSGSWIRATPGRPCNCQLAPVNSSFIVI